MIHNSNSNMFDGYNKLIHLKKSLGIPLQDDSFQNFDFFIYYLNCGFLALFLSS